MKKKIIILVAIVVLLVSWVSIAYSDYAKVAISFDKPKFCITTLTADDGGSGKYIGLGYSFDIDGHLTADGWFDVDSYTYKIFGITIKQGEANPQKENISGQDENQLIYGEPQEPSDTDIINGEGEPLEIEGISQEKAEEIALEQCKVNYDYIKTEFNSTEKRWYVEFWENMAKDVATQTVLIDTEGNVLGSLYAE